MNNLWRKLMLGGSTMALFTATSAVAAFAQDNNDIEQVVVSASRISIAGYTAPTPVTVVGAESIESAAFADIGDAVRQMPALGPAVAPDNGGNSGLASQGTAGLSEFNLRQLGTTRTLVLFDGQRVVNSDVQGNAADIGTLPSAIIQRIDIVTGGASAAWGSDAVAGVVNFVLNKNFTGFKANEEYSNNETNNHQEFKSDATWGDNFFGGRLHVEASASYLMAGQSAFISNMDWFKPVTLFPKNPAAGSTTNPCTAADPCVHTTSNVGSGTYSQGGLITTGPFANTIFTGSSPVQASTYQPGIVWDGNCEFCTYNATTSNIDGLVGVPYHTTTFFGYANYRLTDDIGASIQINYGLLGEHNINSDKQAVATIFSGNPFIPATIQAAMTAQGVASIPVGSNNLAGCDIDNKTVNSLAACMTEDGENIVHRQTARAVFTLNGALGEDWSWQAYFQTGQMREGQQDPEDGLNSNYLNAINAVVVTAANRGASGLAIGQVTCATTLTNPQNGCVPLNVFGTGPIPQPVMDYLDPGRLNKQIEDQGHFITNQQVFSASIQGTLPWELPAGKVAVAAGGEWHLNQQRDIADPLGLGPTAAWQNGNYTQWAGGYSVEEGFAEVDAPLLKNQFVNDLDLNMAGRITNYSTSGLVETWKLGLTSQVNDDIKLRTTWSTDIRAPSLFELFTPPSYAHNTGIDPKTNKSVSLYTGAGGNVNLVPEVATTVSGGVVLTPTFIPGLTASFDWYSIVIKQAIFTASLTQEESQCALGVALYCAQLTYGNPLEAADYPGALNVAYTLPLNASSQTTSGLDFQATYSDDLLGGTMTYGLVGTYVDTFTQSALGLSYEGDNSLSASSPYPGNPRLKMNLTATYTNGPWSGTIQGRYVAPAKLDIYWQTGVNIDNNNVPAVGYLDLRGSYKWNDHMQLYTAINNVNNAPPPSIPSAVGGNGTNLLIYDGLGRVYNMGIRFNFD